MEHLLNFDIVAKYVFVYSKETENKLTKYLLQAYVVTHLLAYGVDVQPLSIAIYLRIESNTNLLYQLLS